MKIEIDNSGGHLRAMRNTLDELRTFINAFHLGRASAGVGTGGYSGLSHYELHLGQIRSFLDTAMRQVEAAEEAKAKKK